MKTMISFPKPVVAAVNGCALGLGTSILPLCDIVYASDKATFSCPYGRLGHTPEGCGSYTLPQVIGSAMVSLQQIYTVLVIYLYYTQMPSIFDTFLNILDHFLFSVADYICSGVTNRWKFVSIVYHCPYPTIFNA